MPRLFEKLLRKARRSGKRSWLSKPQRPTQLRLEQLENRLVPTITDMTQLVQSLGNIYPHSGPTHLYLNFDGYGADSIAAFTGNFSQIQLQVLVFPPVTPMN